MKQEEECRKSKSSRTGQEHNFVYFQPNINDKNTDKYSQMPSIQVSPEKSCFDLISNPAVTYAAFQHQGRLF